MFHADGQTVRNDEANIHFSQFRLKIPLKLFRYDCVTFKEFWW
jgi:hypothetical protein